MTFVEGSEAGEDQPLPLLMGKEGRKGSKGIGHARHRRTCGHSEGACIAPVGHHVSTVFHADQPQQNHMRWS